MPIFGGSHNERGSWVGLYPWRRQFMQAEMWKLFLEQPTCQMEPKCPPHSVAPWNKWPFRRHGLQSRNVFWRNSSSGFLPWRRCCCQWLILLFFCSFIISFITHRGRYAKFLIRSPRGGHCAPRSHIDQHSEFVYPECKWSSRSPGGQGGPESHGTSLNGGQHLSLQPWGRRGLCQKQLTLLHPREHGVCMADLSSE